MLPAPHGAVLLVWITCAPAPSSCCCEGTHAVTSARHGAACQTCLLCRICNVQDYFFHKEGTQNGGNRYATVLTYLNDVEEGGETVSSAPRQTTVLSADELRAQPSQELNMAIGRNGCLITAALRACACDAKPLACWSASCKYRGTHMMLNYSSWALCVPSCHTKHQAQVP